jgi:DNA-binding transcriptional MerR regulator
MSYTVKQLADLSGVSVRTLHYYDEVALLKPAHYGDNNYRYYEQEQLLMLQQILFYKELGFSLDDIKKAITSKEFNKVKALQAHRDLLVGDQERIQALISTIDKTISYLQSGSHFKLEDIFHGFTEDKQSLYLDFLRGVGASQEEIDTCHEILKTWSAGQWQNNKELNDALYENIAKAIDHGVAPASDEAQNLIKKHYELTTIFWTPTKESYIALSQLYGSNADFIAFYDSIHPKLLSFLAQAIKIFAQKQL